MQAFGALGLSPDAGPLEIHRAFRTLASQNHPDRHPTASEQERQQLMQRFAALSAAYHVLLE
jgi:curved DNA-binding protein CbpA